MTRLKRTLKTAVSLIGMCLLLGVISSQAANLTVTTTADGGFGSLRQAIIDAGINAEANIVTFSILTTDPGYDPVENKFTINLLNPLPDIPMAAMTINNNQPQGVTVKGNNSFRIFTLVDSAVVIINNLTISNGYSNGQVGGGIYMGNSSTLTLNGSTVSDNNADGNGGGIYMSNSATLTLNDTTITRNTALNGGGIFIFDSGTLNIKTSAVIFNSTAVGGDGGGVFNGVNGTINATNNTFDSNTAEGGRGGGIFNSATITFDSNTVTDNNATSGGGIFNNFTATMNNNLIALNTALDGTDLLGRGSLGNAFVGAFNLVGNADGSEGLAPGTNQIGTTAVPIDPLIGSLANNGGLTLTRALQIGSPAVDKGNSPGIITDQRGFFRPFDNPSVTNTGDGADVGAFEAQAGPTAASVTVSGRVMTQSGRGVGNVQITMTDADGNKRTATTTSFGYYRFNDVEAGSTVILSARAKRVSFTQSSLVRTVNEQISDAYFTVSSQGK